MKKRRYGPQEAESLSITGKYCLSRGMFLPMLLLASLTGLSASVMAGKPTPTIQGVGFLCNDNVDCQVSSIRHAVEVKTSTGKVLLGVGASVNSSTDPFPISPVLYSSAAGTLFPLPAVDDTENSTFLTASMITPDGLRIASRAHYGGAGNLRTAVTVEVNPGWPEFANPTFTNTLLDPGYVNSRTAASNISDDGTIAYGFGTTGNFLWTASSGITPIALPDGDLGFGSMVGGSNAADGSRALLSDFSCDPGFTVCMQTGHVYNKRSNSFTRLLPLDGDDSAFGFAITSNGEIVAGQSYASTLDSDVFLENGQIVTWNASTGEPIAALGSPDETWYAGNFGGITKDGKAIVIELSDADPKRLQWQHCGQAIPVQ